MEGLSSVCHGSAIPSPGQRVAARAGRDRDAGILAMVSGAETWVDMALSGRSKEPLRHRSLRLPDYLPSHDTTLRVFRLLDPATFEALLARYAALAARQTG